MAHDRAESDRIKKRQPGQPRQPGNQGNQQQKMFFLCEFVKKTEI